MEVSGSWSVKHKTRIERMDTRDVRRFYRDDSEPIAQGKRITNVWGRNGTPESLADSGFDEVFQSGSLVSL